MNATTPPVRAGIDITICRNVQTGMYTYVWNVAERLARRSDVEQPTLILRGPDDVSEPESIERMRRDLAGCRIEHVWDGLSRRRLPRFDTADRLWRRFLLATSPRWKRTAATLFGQDAPAPWWRELDVVHHTAGLVLPMHPGANVMTVSDLIPHHFRHFYKSQAEWFAESFARAADMDCILTYSEHTKDDVHAVLGIPKDRIRAIPLAAHPQYRPQTDRARVTEMLARHGIDGTPYLLHVGSLEPRKNLVRLVEAFAELIRRSPALTHRLVLTGPRFSIWQPIFEAIDALGLKDRVLWLGLVPFEDLPALMAGAEAFVYPSLYEGFGLPPLEAMACGTPVIASNASSVPEVVGDAALLVDPYRVSEMTDAMQRIVSDPALRERLRGAGLARAATFDWDTTARLTLEAYRDAIAAARGRRDRGTAPVTASRAHREVDEWIAGRYAEAGAAS